jgi:hypothetical protein
MTKIFGILKYKKCYFSHQKLQYRPPSSIKDVQATEEWPPVLKR